MKAEIGQSLQRTEDPALLRGEGKYTDDLNEPGQAYAWMVRSQHAHGVLKGIETGTALKMPGVLAVYTGKDLAGYGTHKSVVAVPNLKQSPRRSLPVDRVRFVGDPVAVVVARTALEARDAAEAVELDIEPLPAVTLASEGAKPGAPQLYDELPGNVVCDFSYGDKDKVQAAFEKAGLVVKLALRNTRVVAAPIEPRAGICSYDAASGRFTLTVPGQGVFGMRNQLADILGVAQDKVRVRTHQVGGSFGMKGSIYPEYVCLAHAARALGRPVKWTDERSGSFVSDQQGRDHEMTSELALDKDGHFLALRITGYGNVGAYVGTTAPMMATNNAVKNSPSVYRTPLLHVATKLVVTNTTPVSAYRGAGRPEANYYMERLVDEAAAKLGIDRVELRRRNHIPPQAMPYTAASGQVYDSGEFTQVLNRVLADADWNGFAERKKQSKAKGKLRGRGVGSYLEATSPPNKESGQILFQDGGVTLVTGTLDFGQGHATAFSQVIAARLGVPVEKFRLVQGDSDRLEFGAGTGGSRSLLMSGAALTQAADKVIAKGKALAAEQLEASENDVVFQDGKFVVAGTDRGIGLLELAGKASLDVKHVTEVIQSAFPNGCHVAEVEVDPETGHIDVVRYFAVNDFGTVVNPMLVAGQIHGGVVQGIGQALMEVARYDAEGQLLTGSFMDYAMPRAGDSPPSMSVGHHEVPATTNPLGVKGCGEAGCAGALTSVMNAIIDALSEVGVRHLDMPATPERVWRAIHRK